jgi:hypothetical protein
MFKWILLAIAAIPVSFFIFFFCVSLVEKQMIKGEFVPIPWEGIAEPSKYLCAVNESALKLNLQYGGAFKQERKSGMYQAYMCLWISPDGKTLAKIFGGKTAGMAIRRTVLTSLQTNNRRVVSTDEFGTEDVSGLSDRKVLLNAHLEELVAFHQRRLHGLELRSFDAGVALQASENLEEMRVLRIEEMGLGKFTSSERTAWRFTVKGAWQNMFKSFGGGNSKMSENLERSYLKRPGDG